MCVEKISTFPWLIIFLCWWKKEHRSPTGNGMSRRGTKYEKVSFGSPLEFLMKHLQVLLTHPPSDCGGGGWCGRCFRWADCLRCHLFHISATGSSHICVDICLEDVLSNSKEFSAYCSKHVYDNLIFPELWHVFLQVLGLCKSAFCFVWVCGYIYAVIVELKWDFWNTKSEKKELNQCLLIKSWNLYLFFGLWGEVRGLMGGLRKPLLIYLHLSK